VTVGIKGGKPAATSVGSLRAKSHRGRAVAGDERSLGMNGHWERRVPRGEQSRTVTDSEEVLVA
jgi:hypothetical protein